MLKGITERKWGKRNCIKKIIVSEPKIVTAHLISKMALQKCNVNFSVRILGWISWCEFLEGEFLEGEFLRGLVLLENIGPKHSTPEFGPRFGAQKFASQNSTPNSGSQGAKSPLRKLAPAYLINRYSIRKLEKAAVVSGIGDRQPRTIPTEDLPRQMVFFGGWCANCRNLR